MWVTQGNKDLFHSLSTLVLPRENSAEGHPDEVTADHGKKTTKIMINPPCVLPGC